MQISSGPVRRSSPFQLLRQPRELSGQNLIFIYPFLFDEYVGKYLQLLRQFFVIDVMSQIKTSNVLNVTSSLISDTGPHDISNPAQDVRKSTWPTSSDQITSSNTVPFDYSYHEKQQLLDRALGFINNQVQNSPIYKDYNPVVSSVVAENLTIIPLIVGTKQYRLKSTTLYWTLLSAFATNLKLNHTENVRRLRNVVDRIPPKNYTDYLFSSRARADLDIPEYSIVPIETNIINKLSRYVNTNTNTVLNILSTVTNDKNWQIEIGGLESRRNLSLTSAPTITNTTRDKVYQQALASFNGYVSNILPSIVTSIERIIGPTPVHVNVPNKISTAISDLFTGIEDVFSNMANNITSYLSRVNEESGLQGLPRAIKILDEIKNMCLTNVEIGGHIKKSLESLDRSLVIDIISGSRINSFLRSISVNSNMMTGYSKTLESWLFTLTDNRRTVENQVKDVRENRIRRVIYELFFGINPIFQTLFNMTVPPNNTRLDDPLFQGRYSNILSVSPNMRFGELYKFVQDIYDGLSKIIYFLFLWNFFSYTCIFMRDVETDVEIQRRDALDFPNYLIVLPLDLIKGLFSLWKADLFGRILLPDDPELVAAKEKFDQLQTSFVKGKSGVTADDVRVAENDWKRIKSIKGPPEGQDVEDFRISPAQINNIIDMIASRLAVPNIIIVDTNKKEIYYRFMYMNKSNKLTLQTVESYTKHQLEQLPLL